MTITAERLPDCKVKLSAEIPPPEVKTERDRIVSAYARQARIPGFRPGKAPAAAVEKRYGQEIQNELSEKLAARICQRASEEEKMEIIGIGKVESQLYGPNGSYAWAAEVVIAPEFQLPDYAAIPVELPRVAVDEAQIDSVLEKMRENQAEMTDLPEGALAPGLIAVVSWTATLDGEPLPEEVAAAAPVLASTEGYWLMMPAEGEDGAFLPGFTAQLAGLKAGEERGITAALPEDFQVESLQGKELLFATRVVAVKERRLPEMDDEFAAKAGGWESLETAREEIRKGLAAENERMRQNLVTNEILAHFGQRTDFDLPQHLVFGETQRQVNDMVYESYRRGADQSLIEEHQDEILQSAQARAKLNLKTTFILEKIAEAEGITANDNDLSRHVAMAAQRSGRPLKKVVSELRKGDALRKLRHDIAIAKTLDFLRGRAVVTEVDSAPRIPAEEPASGEPPAEEPAAGQP